MDVALGTKTCRPIVLLASLIATVLGALLTARVAAAQNLLVNGDFSKGSDNAPVAWQSETWI